jgi:hypothetical protein
MTVGQKLAAVIALVMIYLLLFKQQGLRQSGCSRVSARRCCL